MITLVSFTFSNGEETRVSINSCLCKSGFRLGLCPFRESLLLRSVRCIGRLILCYIVSSVLQRIALYLQCIVSCNPISHLTILFRASYNESHGLYRLQKMGLIMKIQDVLKDKRFSEFSLIAGLSGAGNAISTVTVIDTPDGAKWLSGGEFVITTAYMLKDDEEALLAFIHTLHRRKASGLGIKQGRYIESIPDSAISLADQLSLPLLLIPQKLPYADIINPILSELVNQQTNRLIQANLIHTKFTELAVSDASIPDILATFMSIVGVPAAFLDFETVQIWYSDSDSSLAQHLQAERILSHRDLDRTRYDLHLIANQSRSFGVLIFEKGVLERETGEESANALLMQEKDPGFKIALENTTTNIILREQTIISNRQVAERYKGLLIQDILIHNIKSETEIHNRAEIFGWDFHDGGIVLEVDINNIKQRFKRNFSNNTSKMLEEMSTEIFDISIREILKFYPNAHYVKLSDIIIFVLSIRPRERKQMEKNFAEAFSKIQRCIANIPFTISFGIGRYYENIEQIHLSYQEAREVIRLSYIFSWFDRILYYEKMDLFRVLLPILDNQEALESCRNCLQPLLDYDRDNGKNMLETLQIVAECDWNLKLAAERMFLHPNSVKYRMEQIGKLIHRNFREHSDRLFLEIAVLTYTMSKKLPDWTE